MHLGGYSISSDAWYAYVQMKQGLLTWDLLSAFCCWPPNLWVLSIYSRSRIQKGGRGGGRGGGVGGGGLWNWKRHPVIPTFTISPLLTSIFFFHIKKHIHPPLALTENNNNNNNNNKACRHGWARSEVVPQRSGRGGGSGDGWHIWCDSAHDKW